MKRQHSFRGASRTALAMVVAALLFASLTGALQAQEAGRKGTEAPPVTAVSGIDPAIADLKEPTVPRLQGELDRLVQALADNGQSGLEAVAAQRNIKLYDDRVLIVVEGDVEALPDQLAALGGEVDSIAHDRLSLLAPVAALRDMAALPGVGYVRLPLPAVALEGSVTSEGVSVIGADAWHSAGYKGSGVTAAVVDFGFYNYTGLQGSNDLPANIVCVDYTTGSNCGNADASMEHGSACAELLYDVAPGVDTLYLYAFDDDADISLIVTHMIANGIDVASMSISWVNGEPYDGSGPISTEVNRAKTSGDIFWAVAAGNYRQRHYEATYSQGDCTWGHDFDASASCGNLNGLSYQSAGDRVCIFLEWNAWPLTDQDYDLWIYRYNGGLPRFVTAFRDVQDGNDPPVEGGCFTVPTDDWYYFLVNQWSASSDHYFEIFAWYDDFGVAVNASSVNEPATADGAVAVSVFDQATPTVLETYSSMGPRNPTGGGPYDAGACGGVPTSECKPDFAGPDWVSTVTYGAQNFGGSSTAAPHVAGAAALVKSAYPAYSSDQIYDYLKTQAPNPGGRSASQDPGWGWGRIFMGNTPTAVTLARFQAIPRNEDIQIEWETAAELDTLGFNLYRSDSPEDGWLRLNDALIPSQSPGSPGGATYTWLDTDVEAGLTYYYKLEALDIYGATTLHGPVEITAPAALHVIYLPLVNKH